jgi:regulator of nonsense transcripts 2
LNGIHTETKPLIKLITEVTGGKEGNYAVTDANVLVAFAKTAGFEILGVPPGGLTRYTKLVQAEATKLELHQKEMQDKSEEEKANVDTVVASTKLITEGTTYCTKVAELFSERAVSSELSNEFLTHCKGAYKFLSISLVATHGKLQKMEKRCEQDRLLSGSLSDVREKGLSDARKLKESLLRTVEALSDVLDLPMPRLKEEENEENESGAGGLELWTKGGGEDGADFGPFDDEETKGFYCDVPDFLTTVPPALLGISQEEIEKRKAENILKYGSGFEDIPEEVESATPEVAGSTEEQLWAAEEDETKEIDESAAETADLNKDTPHYKLMVLLEQELPECSRREDIDELAEKFCTNHGSSKNARKRLIRTLFHVPRTRLDLLPYYSRMTASLSKVWTDISDGLVSDLEQQFHGQAKFKKNQIIESRLRTARYIGELTKFRLAPPMVAFRCIRRCLDDFTGGNVDVACCMLESCGRYLYRLKHTNQRITSLMEAMTRLGKAKVRCAVVPPLLPRNRTNLPFSTLTRDRNR